MKKILTFIVISALFISCDLFCDCGNPDKDYLFIQAHSYISHETTHEMCLPPQIHVDYFCYPYNFIKEEHRIEHFCNPLEYSDSTLAIIGRHGLNLVNRFPIHWEGFPEPESMPSATIEGISNEGVIYFTINDTLKQLPIGEEFKLDITKIDTMYNEPWDEVFYDPELEGYYYYDWYGRLLPYTDTCILKTIFHYYISNEGYFDKKDIQFMKGYEYW